MAMEESSASERVFLYPYQRAPSEFMNALLTGPDLKPIREKMAEAHCPHVLEGSAAKVFVWPHQYSMVLARLSNLDQPLRSSHVIVTESLLPSLEAAVSTIPSLKNVRVKRNSVRVVQEVLGQGQASDQHLGQIQDGSAFGRTAGQDIGEVRDWEYVLGVERTFICSVSMLRDATSVNQSTTEAHAGVNPRRYV